MSSKKYNFDKVVFRKGAIVRWDDFFGRKCIGLFSENPCSTDPVTSIVINGNKASFIFTQEDVRAILTVSDESEHVSRIKSIEFQVGCAVASDIIELVLLKQPVKTNNVTTTQ